MMRYVAASSLLVMSSGCGLAQMTVAGVGSKVAVSKALDNRGSPQESVLVHGFLERHPSDLAFNAVTIASDLSGDLVSLVSVGRQGYYTLFVPPGTYRMTAYVDRDGDGFITPNEIAGQISAPVFISGHGDVAYFGLDIAMDHDARSNISTITQVLQDTLTLDEGIPSIERSDDLFAPVYGQENIDRGLYESTTSFFNYVSPIQHLDEIDLTAGRTPIIFVHGIDDSPQIFDRFEKALSEARYEPLFFYYPGGARLPAMAELFYHLFFSGQVLPTFESSALIAHSMGGLVARGSLNFIKNKPGVSHVTFYGSLVSPYGGVSAAKYGVKTGPAVVPSWMDLSPESPYLAGLFAPLPPDTSFSMESANAETTSDGVIALSSQRRSEALDQAEHEEILPQTHVGIMSDETAISMMLGWVDGAIPPADTLPIQAKVDAKAPVEHTTAETDSAAASTDKAVVVNKPEESSAATATDAEPHSPAQANAQTEAHSAAQATGAVDETPALGKASTSPQAVNSLGDLEHLSRVHLLRVALTKTFAKQDQNVLVSVIAPTVARLRIYDQQSSLVLQLSAGQGIRIDVPILDKPIFERPWPDEEAALDVIAAEIVDLSQSLLRTSSLPSRPEVPKALRVHDETNHTPTVEPVRTHPPPVVFASGIMLASGGSPETARVQIPLKMDGYFGHFGMGLDVRATTFSGLAKTKTASIIYQPWIIGGGFRFRAGHSSSLLSATFGISGGVEVGRANVYGPDIKRFGYKDEDLLKREHLLSGLAYASATLGFRIHQDFYAIGMGEFGLRFPAQDIVMDDYTTIHFLHQPFFGGMLGIEVRVP